MSGVIRHVAIRGRVQGVGYRAWVADEADARNLEGWVRNCRDGSVEALFAGPADVVAAMIAACRRGPSLARVSAVQELEAAGAAGLTIEDTLLPQAFGQAKPQLISLEEGIGKMKAALDGRSDPSLVIMGRTGAVSITGPDDAIARAKAYEATGVDALFFTGIKSHNELEALAAATRLPIVLGGAPEEMSDPAWLARQRVRIALQGHAPFAAATQAVYETLKALREGTSPKGLRGLASSELTARVMREADMKTRSADFLGLKKA